MFSGVFASISDAYFKCFAYLQRNVVSVASGYFKSRPGVASPSSSCAALPWRLLSPSTALHPSQTTKGRAEGWWRGREHARFPSVTLAGIGFRGTPVARQGLPLLWLAQADVSVGRWELCPDMLLDWMSGR